MKSFFRLLTFCSAVVVLSMLTGCATTQTSSLKESKVRAPVIFMAGDSTMANKPLFPPQPERGWGQMLQEYFKEPVRVENHAVNGRSTKSFRDQGLWQKLIERVRPGDYVIIQFGHNDEKKSDSSRYAEPFGSFKQNLERYVKEVREHGGKPILATPVARRIFSKAGALTDTHGDYAVAVRQAATEQQVPLLDLQKRSSELLTKLGPEQSKKLHMWVEPGEFATIPEGRKDDTHYNAFGASRICDLAIEEMRAATPELVPWLRINK